MAPFIEVDPPVPVRRDDVTDLVAGEGDVITADSEIALCYREIDPRNGETLHNDFETGSGEIVTVSELSPGLQAGVVDQNVGSTLIIRADVEPPAIYAVMVRDLD